MILIAAIACLKCHKTLTIHVSIDNHPRSYSIVWCIKLLSTGYKLKQITVTVVKVLGYVNCHQ